MASNAPKTRVPVRPAAWASCGVGTGLLYRETKSQPMPDETIERAELALIAGRTFKELVDSGKIDRNAVPLAGAIVDAICDNHPMHIPWHRFYQ